MGKRQRMLIGVVAAVVIVGGYFVMVTVMGAEIGQPCDKEWGCKGMDAYCLEGDGTNVCSRSCGTRAECPDGFACAPITVWTLDGKSAAPDESSDMACIKEAPSPAE